MTKKDFQLIAAALLAAKPSAANIDKWTTWCNVVSEFSLRLAQTNPRFDASRFSNACMGVK